jgi:hypothetical protein
MTEPFALDGDGGPVFQKSDPTAFKPHPESMLIRQRIYAMVQANKMGAMALSDICRLTDLPYKKVYQASKKLCLKGLLKREEEPKYRTKKTGEKVQCGKIVKLLFIAPFSDKKGAVAYRNLW